MSSKVVNKGSTVGRKPRGRVLRSPIVADVWRFCPSAAAVTDLQNAIGRDLSESDISALKLIVERFVSIRQLETKAAKTEQALRYLRRMQSAVHSCAVPKDLEPAALAAIETKLGQVASRYKYVAGPIQLRTLMLGIDSVLDKAIEEWSNDRELDIGVAWHHLIDDLTQFCKERRLPTGAASSDTRAVSPFVQFVRQLQKHFPSKIAQYNDSDTGLSKGIQRARKHRAGAFTSP